jgi:hypothetical protein
MIEPTRARSSAARSRVLARDSFAQEELSLSYGNAAFQQDGPDLHDGALAD